MAYQEQLTRLSDRTEAQIIKLWRRHVDGEFDVDRFIVLAAAVVARSNARAATTADLALTATIARQLGRMVGPVGIVDTSDQQVLRAAVRKVVDTEVQAENEELAESREVRLARLARNEPLVTATKAMGAAMAARGITGWIRKTDPDPCPLCVSWADGVVRPPTVPMARHIGCSCIQQPVL